MKKKIASIQFSVKLGDIPYNQEKVRSLIEQAKNEYDPDIILLPETWNLGFFPENVEEVAEEFNSSSSFILVKKLAKDLRINIIAGSIIVKENGFIRNRALIFDRNGNNVHKYDKGHLFSPSKEHEKFTKGIKNQVITLDGVKIAHIICYDLRFPEYIRRLALEGALILFVSAQWPNPRLEHWNVLQKARAIENQFYLVSANGSGSAYGLDFCGHSSVFDPWGDVVKQLEDEEDIIYSEIDIDKLMETRKIIPIYDDRNVNLYR